MYSDKSGIVMKSGVEGKLLCYILEYYNIRGGYGYLFLFSFGGYP